MLGTHLQEPPCLPGALLTHDTFLCSPLLVLSCFCFSSPASTEKCKKDKVKDPTMNRSWTRMLYEVKTCSDMMFIYTSFPSLSLLLFPMDCAKPFPHHSLLRHGVSEEQGTEQDRNKEMHPHSVAQSAAYLLLQQKCVQVKSCPGTQKHFQTP